MNNFQFNRFAKTFGWTMAILRKDWLTSVMSIGFVFTLALCAHTLFGFMPSSEDSLAMVTGFCAGIFSVYVILGGTCIMQQMVTKQQIIMMKMLPASDLEKFLSRFIYATLIWYAGGMMAFCSADVLNMLLQLLTGTPVESATWVLWTNIFEENQHVTMDGQSYEGLAWELQVIGFWVHSFYMLGGMLLRKRQFAVTTLALFGLGLLAVWGIQRLGEALGSEMLLSVMDTYAGWFCVLLLAMIAANYYMAYRLFKRCQVVHKQWLNI